MFGGMRHLELNAKPRWVNRRPQELQTIGSSTLHTAGKVASSSAGLSDDLDRRFRLLKEKSGGEIVSEVTYHHEESNRDKEIEVVKGKKTKLNVNAAYQYEKSNLGKEPKEYKAKKTKLHVV